MVSLDRYDCIWEMFVKGNVPGEKERRGSHRSGGPKKYLYTTDQLDYLLSELRMFQQEVAGRLPQLAELLQTYMDDANQQKANIGQLDGQH